MKRAITVLSLVLLLSACFAEPVEESFVVKFGDGDDITVENVIEIHDDAGKGTPLAVRLATLRDELIAERDPWSLRFARISPDTEEYKRERADGKISRVTRVAQVTEIDLVKLMSDFANVNLVSGRGWRELLLSAGRADRATSRQRTEVDEQLKEWTQKYIVYLAASTSLYGYLDQEPLRARPVLRSLFGDLMEQPAPEDVLELTDDEKEMVAAVRASMDELSNAMSAQGDGAYTFEELTRLVYDPFPASITIRTNGQVLESEGFERVDGETVKLPKLSVQGSLLQLEDRWISPDPFLARLRVDPNEKPFDLDAFLKLARRVTALPSPAAMRQAIDEALTPGNAYRVRWEEGAGVGGEEVR